MYRSLSQLFELALRQRIFSGASLLVASRESSLYQGVWGQTQFDNGSQIDCNTYFDLASLTKPLVTASLCIRAMSEGMIHMEDILSRFIPRNLIPADKREICIRHLLGHCSGFPAYKPFYQDLIRVAPAQRRPALLGWILESPLLDHPGRTCTYSDLGFILLGMIVETVMEKPLDELAAQLLFQPRGIQNLTYLRLETTQDARERPRKLGTLDRLFAATEICSWRERLLDGEVHDENAYCLDGVAGHAGLFGTAEGIYRWLGFLWEIYHGSCTSPHWSSSVVRALWERQNVLSECTWALGFDTPSRTDSSAGKYFSRHSVGHLGFTGTSFWIDLEKEIMVILLTNRVHPSRDNSALRSFRPLLHDTVMEIFYDDSRT